jgi:hypothetical protein
MLLPGSEIQVLERDLAVRLVQTPYVLLFSFPGHQRRQRRRLQSQRVPHTGLLLAAGTRQIPLHSVRGPDKTSWFSACERRARGVWVFTRLPEGHAQFAAPPQLPVLLQEDHVLCVRPCQSDSYESKDANAIGLSGPSVSTRSLISESTTQCPIRLLHVSMSRISWTSKQVSPNP